jgi:hypothetical protein
MRHAQQKALPQTTYTMQKTALQHATTNVRSTACNSNANLQQAQQTVATNRAACNSSEKRARDGMQRGALQHATCNPDCCNLGFAQHCNMLLQPWI